MEIIAVASFLVYPGKKVENHSDVHGTMLSLSDDRLGLLKDVFYNAESDCTTPIHFLHDKDGKQNNPVRDELIDFIKAVQTGKQPLVTGEEGLEVLKVAQKIEKLAQKTL